MLRRDNVRETVELVSQGFMVCVEAEKGVSVDLLKMRLADACKWVEGVGETDVEHIGILEDIDDEEIDGTTE